MTCTVHRARPADGKALFALVDVEMQIAGVIFGMIGIQAQREPDGKTLVRLPTFKDVAAYLDAAASR